jgi:hypothetical protein
MGAVFEKLTWCIAHLGDDANWWIDSLSDEIHWDMTHLGLIDPHQLEYFWELLSPLRDCGFQEEILEAAFCKFRIEKELPHGRVQLMAVDTRLVDTEEKLFLLPYAYSDSEERYTEFIEQLMQFRVKWLNMTFDFKQPVDFEDVEIYFRDHEREKNLDETVPHPFEEIVSILEYIPDGLDKDESNVDDLEEGLSEDVDEGTSELPEDAWERELKEDIFI